MTRGRIFVLGCGGLILLVVLGVCAAALSSKRQTQPVSNIASEPRTGAPTTPFDATVVIAASGCVEPNAATSHVYSPDRLRILQPCITVTGRIDFIRHEKDGDYHIGLKLDPQFAGLANSCN